MLADTRRLDTCFAAIDYFEGRGLPFIIGVNCFNGTQIYDPEEVRRALDIDENVPIMLCDARQRESNKQLLTTLMEHVMAVTRAKQQHAMR